MVDRSATLAPELKALDFSAFVTMGQAARLAGVSLTAVRDWCDAGKLRSVRDPANRRLIVRADLVDLLHRRQQS